MRHATTTLRSLLWCLLSAMQAFAESPTVPSALRDDAARLSAASLATPLDAEAWRASLTDRRRRWLRMLGLDPLPERTPLEATVTGVLDRGDIAIEKLHFQPLPGAHATANLYRPARAEGRLPAVLFLCGHGPPAKAAPDNQAHGRWFARHGYVALVLDPIQLGEVPGLHHGTYSHGRWEWHSRGYTPAGAEVWNGMRALDLLASRSDVDAKRVGVTGLSGGGGISWFLGAADERVKAVAPVCQTGSVAAVVADRGDDGHCDCAFWINHERWCWPDLGALVAPRPLLIASGARDSLWRPAGFRETAASLRRQYAALGAAEMIALVEDDTPHGYTPALRRAVFSWFDRHLAGRPEPVTDDVTDDVEPPEHLLVFAGKPPAGDRMHEVDRLLSPSPDPPEIGDPAAWRAHREAALRKLLATTFRYTREPEPPRVRDFRDGGENAAGRIETVVFKTADGLTLRARSRVPPGARTGMFLVAAAPAAEENFHRLTAPPADAATAVAMVEVRHTAETSLGPGVLWSVRRTCPLLGYTLEERQVADLLAGIGALRARSDPPARCAVFGAGATAAPAIYAALLDDSIGEIVLADPPTTHTDPAAPQFLGVLRVGDLPHNLALLHPRPITFVGTVPAAYEWTRRLYERLGSADRFRVVPEIRHWRSAE